MTQKAEPLTKFLLPIDGKGTYKASCALAASLASVCRERVKEITLLHVMAGRYLSTHMANIDFRVDTVLESELFQRLKKDFIDKQIKPELYEAKDLIQRLYPGAAVDFEVKDGKPAKVIINFVAENNYSTIIMQRRCMDPVKGAFIGSVTSGILYGEESCSVYIPGTDFPRDGLVEFRSLLVPVDGSQGSMAAASEAGVLMGCVPHASIVLLNVVDVVDIAKAAEKNLWPSPVQEAEEILKNAERQLVKSGVDPSRIVKKVLAGDPADMIVKEAESSSADIVYIGRTVRSAVTDVIVGSVGRAVLGRCARKTMAVVTPEKD